MSYFKNIKVINGNIVYINPNIYKITTKYLNISGMRASYNFIKCQQTKCTEELNAYTKKIVKILSIKKISISTRKKEINRLSATPEYKKSIECIIKQCYNLYIKSVSLIEKSFTVNDKYYDNLIKEYKKTISSLKNTKINNKLVQKFHKSPIKKLNRLTLKQIKENHKAFIKNYEQGLKFSIEQKKYNDKYFKKLKKFIPVYKKLLAEGKKEEYIYHKTFDPFLVGLM
jgi:hypothetical protein